MASDSPPPLKVIAAAVVYLLAARLGLLLATLNHSVSPVWPATGVALFILIAWGRSAWPAIWMGAFTANALTDVSIHTALLIACGNTLEAVLGEWLYATVQRRRSSFDYHTDALGVCLASLLAPLASAAVGLGALLLAGVATPANMGGVFATWWIGDALGGLALTPALLTLRQIQGWWRVSLRGLLKTVLLVCSIGISGWAVFALPAGRPLLFLLFPNVLLGAWLFGARGTHRAALIINGLCIAATLRGLGPFVHGSVNENLVHLQIFLVALGITGVMVADFAEAKTLELPSIVLAVCWTMSGALFLSFDRASAQEEEGRLDRLVEAGSAELQKYVRTYEEALRAGEAFVGASERISYREWEAFVRRLMIDVRYPGIFGLGLVQRVEPPEVSSLERTVRSEGLTEFRVHAFPGDREAHPTPSEGGDLYVIKYAEPLAANRLALGLDLASEGRRRAAAERARATGLPTATSPIVLVQDQQRRLGLLLYHPIYRSRSDPLEESGKELWGFIYAPFIFDQLFAGAARDASSEVVFEVYDEDSARSAPVYRRAGGSDARSPRSQSHRQTTLELGQRRFRIDWHRSAQFVPPSQATKSWVGLLGALISLLVASLIVNLELIGRRSKVMAEELTKELQRGEEETRLLIQSVSEYAIIKLGTEGEVLSWNEGAHRMQGYERSEVLGRHFAMFYREEAREAGWPMALLKEAREKGSARDEGYRVRKDGTEYWAEAFISRIVDGEGQLLGFAKVTHDLTSRRQREVERQELLSRVAMALSAARMAAWSLDLRTGAIWRSEEHDAIFGYAETQPSWSLESFLSHLLPEERERLASGLAATLETGQQEMEARFKRVGEDEVRWLWGIARAVRNEDGQVAYVMGLIQDVTQQKHEQAERLAALEWQQSVLEASNYAIISCDNNGVIQTFNMAAERMLGYRASDVVGKANQILLHDPEELLTRSRSISAELGVEIGPGFEVIAARTRSTGYADEREWTYVRKNGERLPVSLSITTLNDDRGVLTGYLAIAIDLTERKKAEEALKVAHARLTRVVEATHAGIWERSLQDEGVFFIDGQGKRLLGFDPQAEVSYRDVRNRLDSEDVREAEGHLASILAAHGTRFEWDLRCYPDPDVAEARWLSFAGDIVYDENGQGSRFVATFSDVTARVRSTEALQNAVRSAEAANEAKSAFLAAMSHEIRTPLNGVIGMAELLSDSGLNDQQKEYARIIQRSGAALLSLISDILDSSKIEAGKLELESGVLSVAHLIESQCEILSGKALQKGLQLGVFSSPRLPLELAGDEARLGQVLLNLLGNAVKFTTSGGVSVRAFELARHAENRELQWVRFEVEDTGRGISREGLARLFRPFSQVASSAGSRAGGTGLGLFICKQLVEAMGGELGVASEEGKGSTFWFEVPLAVPATGQPGRRLLDSDEAGKLWGLHVLVVEPDLTSRDALIRYCRAFLMDVEGVDRLDQVEAAMEAARPRRPFDVLVIASELLATRGPLSETRDLWFRSLKARHVNVIILGNFGQPRGDLEGVQYLQRPLRQAAVIRALSSRPDPSTVAFSPASASAPAVAGPPRNETLTGKILVADDVPVNQLLAVRMLEAMGCSATAVADGTEVLEALDKDRYDLILMDCSMPQMDGYEASRAIRASSKAEIREIPIIALTANAMQGDDKRCFAAGMSDYLSKPLRKDELRRVVGRWLNR